MVALKVRTGGSESPGIITSYIKSKGNKQSDGTSTIKLYKITKINKKKRRY